jgi:hypothetical protein
MSALGHKRTYAVQKGMSALPPKADIRERGRLVPQKSGAMPGRSQREISFWLGAPLHSPRALCAWRGGPLYRATPTRAG